MRKFNFYLPPSRRGTLVTNLSPVIDFDRRGMRLTARRETCLYPPLNEFPPSKVVNPPIQALPACFHRAILIVVDPPFVSVILPRPLLVACETARETCTRPSNEFLSNAVSLIRGSQHLHHLRIRNSQVSRSWRARAGFETGPS